MRPDTLRPIWMFCLVACGAALVGCGLKLENVVSVPEADQEAAQPSAEEQAAAQLQADLKSQDPEVRARAAAKVVSQVYADGVSRGQSGTAAWLEGLKDEDRAIRYAIAYALYQQSRNGGLGDDAQETLLPVLIEALEDKETVVFTTFHLTEVVNDQVQRQSIEAFLSARAVGMNGLDHFAQHSLHPVVRQRAAEVLKQAREEKDSSPAQPQP